MPINDILRGLIPPLLVALVVLAAAWRPWRRGPAPWGRLGSAVAIGASLAAGAVLAARGWPGMPLDNPDRWLGVIAVIGAAAAAMEPRLRGRTTRAATAVVVVALCMALLLWFELSMRSRVVEGLIRLAAYTAVGSLLVVEVRSLAQRTPGARASLVLWVAATGQFLVMLQSGVSSSAIPAAALAVVMGWFVVLAWWRPDLGATAAAAPVGAMWLMAVYVGAHAYTPLWSFLAILAAVSAAWAGRAWPLRRMRPWAATLVCVLLAALCAAVAVGLTPHGFDFGGGGSGDGYE